MSRVFAVAAAALVTGAAIALAATEPPKPESSDVATRAGDKGEKKPQLPEFKSSKEKASYVIGLNIGQQVLRDFGRADALDPDSFMKGLKSGLGGDRPLDGPAMREAVIAYRVEVIKQDAVKFMDENKKKEGVKATASGLQYQVITSGAPGGKSPKATSQVRVHYTGTLVNGTKFDSSVDRGEPTEMAVSDFVPGWVEGLQLMKEGDKWRLFVPPELGYKEKGKGNVPPHAVMIFEMELLKVLD